MQIPEHRSLAGKAANTCGAQPPATCHAIAWPWRTIGDDGIGVRRVCTLRSRRKYGGQGVARTKANARTCSRGAHTCGTSARGATAHAGELRVSTAKAGNSWVEVDSVMARRGGSACMPRISGVSKCGSSKLDGDDASCSHGWWRPTPRGRRARANPPRRIRRWRAETLPEEPGRRASLTTSCRTRRAGSW